MAYAAPAQTQLYDDFNAAKIDPDRWVGVQSQAAGEEGGIKLIREIEFDGIEGHLLLSHRVVGGTSSDTGLRISRNRLNIVQDPNAITAVKFDVMVRDFSMLGCTVPGSAISSVRADFIGFLFNDGSSTGPQDLTGDILGIVGLSRSSNSTDPAGIVHAVGILARCVEPTCSGQTSTFTQVDLGPVPTGVAVTLLMNWDRANKKVEFERNAEAVQSIPYTQDDSRPPVGALKALEARGQAPNCTVGPRPFADITGVFDNVLVNAATNRAPVAQDDSYSVPEDTLLTVGPSGVLRNDSDPDGDPLTAILVSGPAHAQTFTLNANGSFTYAPTANFSGTDSFTYKANDGKTDSNIATVRISVNPAGAISGTVCANAPPPCGAGNPAIADATINVRNSDSGFQMATGVTVVDGTYTVSGLAPRNYKISAEANGFATRFFNNQTSFTSANLVPVNSGATTAGINFGLPGNAGGITGQVTLIDGVTPVRGAQISARTATGDQVLFTRTDANGNYNTQRRLAAGTYLIRVFAAGFPITYYVGTNSAATATPIGVTANADTPGINVRLSSAKGGISGQVTSAATGAPLAAVGVSLFDAATGGFIQGFETDATGHYDTGQVLAPGQYKVAANLGGSETIAYNNKFSVATGDPVTVTNGSTTSGIDIALPLLGGITGHVTNAQTGGPLQNAIILVFDAITGAFVTSTATAADGSYTINGLNPLQAYRVQVRLVNFGTLFFNHKLSFGTADVVTVPAGSTVAIDFAVAPGGGISGTVTDATTSAPVQGVNIDIIDGASANFSINNFIFFGVTTDANGNFNTGRVLAPGVYKVRARKFNSGYIQTFYVNGRDLSTATPVTVAANADFTANIALSRGGTITGTIRDRASNQPISGASVVARRVVAVGFFGDFTVTTDPSGNYTITGLHAGEWLISAQATGHISAWYSGDPSNPATDFSSSTPIPITGTSTVNNVDLNLQLGGGAIEGRITRSDNGQPVPVGTVTQIRGPLPRVTNVTALNALTNKQGDYSFTGLAPGQYVVEANPNQIANGTAVGFFPFGAISRSTGAPVTVSDGAPTTADFQVLGFPGGATPRAISGTLRDPSNNPIRDGLALAYEPTGLTLVRAVGVFDDGSFGMDGLAPGRYLILAQTEKTFVTTVFSGEPVLNAGTLMDVTAGDVAGINLVLPNNAGTITGTITRSDTGQPLMGASISVRNFFENSVAGAASRADGTFLVRGVAPGVYKVRVSAPKFVTKFFRVGVPGGAPIFNDGSFVTVTSGSNTPGINVALDPTGGALTGTVRRQDTLEPVVAAVVGIRDATTGSSVTFIATDANGVYKTEGLAAGNYKITVFDVAGQRDGIGNVLAARFATQWFSDQSTLGSGDTVTVAPVGVTGGIDFLVSPTQGAISGRAFLSDGTTPLGGVGISIFDQATGGFVRGAGISDKNGNYSATGLAPGTYVAQASALGFAQQFHPGVPTTATATTLTVASDLPNINFSMTHSSDITGAINYGGAQTGTLRVRLFSDAALTHQVYESAIPSPSFIEGQPYSFTLPPPDTRGLLPGTYYLSAFLDSNGDGFQGPTEAFGQLGAPDALTVAEATTLTGKNFSIADPPATTNTPPVADPQQVIVVQGSSNNSIILTGSDAQTATVNLTYTVTGGPSHGTLTITPVNPQQRFYTPNPGFTGTDTVTFTVRDRGDPDNCGTPSPTCAPPLTSPPATVTIQVTPNAGVTSTALAVPVAVAPGEAQALGNIRIDENATGALAAGSAIKLSLPAGMTFSGLPTVSFQVANGAMLNPPILESPGVLSFTLAAPSTTGPASILVSGIKVNIPPGFLAPDVTSADVLTTVFGPNPGLQGLSQSVKNGTVVTVAAGPTLATVSPATAARGAVGRLVVLTGANFAPDASVSFGTGVFVAKVSVDSSTQITVTLNVSPETALGLRDVTVVDVSAEQSVTKTGVFEITGTTPTVATASGPLVQGLDNQLVTITGTNFAPPTTTPPDLRVTFNSTGVTVTNVGYTSGTTIAAIVNVDATAPLTVYDVTVTNPDGGSATGFELVSVVATGGLAAPPSKSTSPPPPPPPPSITSLSTNSGPIGSGLTINGSGFSSTATSNSVTFAGASGVRVTANVTVASSGSLTVTVPAQATTGNVTVAVSGLVSNSVPFTVTTPVLGTVFPGSVTTNPNAVTQVPLTLSGSRFVTGATVSFGGPVGDITQVIGPTVSSDGTTITLTVSIPPTPAQTGPRDVTVTNPDVCSPPAAPGCLSSTLSGGFSIQLPPAAAFTITLPDFPDTSTYLPSVTQVSLTRLATGACDPTSKVVTPAGVALRAQFVTTTGLTPPPQSVTFTIASSALPGTATNEDCEVDPANPTKDFSVGTASLASQQVVVTDSGGGVYQTTLYSYDRGGKVTITVTGTTGAVTVTGSLALPVDTDGDDLPDAYEKNAVLNADQTGANVLNFQNADQNGNGVTDRNDRFARDGLSNFEKYRGVYTVGPTPGSSGVMGGFQRLGAGVRHLFVRGRGFREDPAVPSGFCGIDSTTGTPVADATLSATNPCPAFQVGTAFQNIGVGVHNVSGSFTASTELPRTSYVNPTQPTLDMATVIYDGTACKGSEACNTTSKFGVRQWGNGTLGYTPVFGTATTYGATTVYKRAVESYFNNRPYQHRTNDPARVLTALDGTPMLAPITMVGDSSASGSDNGLTDSGEATVSGQLAGDTYIPGSFGQQLTALDANADGCVELPTVADPTTIARCTPNADTATSPSATKQQVVRSVVTHELGHGTGVNTHTADSTDIMYLSTINYTRDGHFSSTAAGLVQTHNKMQQ